MQEQSPKEWKESCDRVVIINRIEWHYTPPESKRYDSEVRNAFVQMKAGGERYQSQLSAIAPALLKMKSSSGFDKAGVGSFEDRFN